MDGVKERVALSAAMLAIAAAASATVQTNGSLLRQIRGWEPQLACDAGSLKDAVGRAMEQAAPWRVAALQSTNGCYEWGLYARLYHGCSKFDK